MPKPMLNMADLSDLADALNGHQVTNEDGQVVEETTTEPVESEENHPEESETDKGPVPEQETAETEPEVAEDEEGKKYVPEPRFKEVYAKLKEAERQLKSLDKQPKEASPAQPSINDINVDRAALLETEMLKSTLPQFNPESSDYNETLDQMGAEIYQASMRLDRSGNPVPTITKIQAARIALERAKKLMGAQEVVRSEARQIKSVQADSGLTNANRKEAPVDPSSFNDPDEMEAYLKKTGQW